MTRGQIKSAAVRRAFREFRSAVPLPDSGVGDPFTLDEDLNNVADELTRAIHICYLFETTNIVSGQVRYCAPPLYEIDGVEIILPDGASKAELRVRKSEQFKVTNPNYLIDGATGTPAYFITEEANDGILYPTASYNMASGIIMRGLGLYDNTAWATETSECPLPARYHMGLVHGLAAEIAPDPRVEMAERAIFSYEKGHFESEMANYVDSARSRASDGGPRLPAGPLNL